MRACEIRTQVRTALYPSPSCPAPIQGSGGASGSRGLLLQQAACSWSEEGRRYSWPGCPQRSPCTHRPRHLSELTPSHAPFPARVSLRARARARLGVRLQSPNRVTPPLQAPRLKASPPGQCPHRSCVPEGRTQDRRWWLWEAVGHPEPLLPGGAQQPNKQLTRGQRNRPSDPETQDTL